MAITEDMGRKASWPEPLSCIDNRTRVCTDQQIPAGLHGFHPLGLLTQRQAGYAKKVGLFLHTAGIGQNECSVFFENEHIQIANRFYEPGSVARGQKGIQTAIGQSLPRAGMDRKDDRNRNLGQRDHDASQAVGQSSKSEA
jgi:hypothetical protein